MASSDSSSIYSDEELLDSHKSRNSSSLLSHSARSDNNAPTEDQLIGTLHFVSRKETNDNGLQIVNQEPDIKSARHSHKLPFYKALFYRLYYGKVITPNSRIKKLPPHRSRYWAWKYEVLRPWEPQPPRNYYKLLHEENPWYNEPPTQFRIFLMLTLFLVFSLSCAYLPWLLNIDVLRHRENVLKVPSWVLPWWFNILAAAFTHVGNAFGIWFIYLTGGFRKHWKKMIPWLSMLVCQALWPDILFSWRVIILATVVCGLGSILSLLTVIFFAFKMGYAGLLIFFYNIWTVYCTVVLSFLVYRNGYTYSM